MRKRISILTLAICVAVCLAGSASALDAPKIAGKWQFTLTMSDGSRAGILTLEQDGSKLSGTCEVERHEPSALTGSIEGAKVSLKMDLHGSPFTLVGTVEGDSMTGTTEPAMATWKATRK